MYQIELAGVDENDLVCCYYDLALFIFLWK
jgi:hypothetical protein